MAKKEEKKPTPLIQVKVGPTPASNPVAAPMAQPTAAPQFLTTANWTPDIVAAILAMILGNLLGVLLALVLSFNASPAILVAAFFFLLLSSFWHSRLCKHMELTGHRFFHQCYFMLMPLMLVFASVSLLILKVYEQINAAIDTAASAGKMVGLQTMLPKIIPVITADTLIKYIGVMAIITLLPFGIQGRKGFKIPWLIPLLIPIATCTLIWIFFVAGG